MICLPTLPSRFAHYLCSLVLCALYVQLRYSLTAVLQQIYLQQVEDLRSAFYVLCIDIHLFYVLCIDVHLPGKTVGALNIEGKYA